MAERFDVVVVGGGPAGAAAAITAARRGKRVLLLERGRFPRHKVCGEFVSADALRLLRELLDSSDLLKNAVGIAKTRVFLERGGFEAPIEPAAVSIRRYDLDFALWKATVAAGVDARQECGGYDVTQTDGMLYSSGREHRVECKRIIYAAGRLPNKKAIQPLIGIKAHFRVKDPVGSVDLYFGDEGYCGVQPLGSNVVNVCALVAADAIKDAGADRMRAAFDVHEKLREERWEQVTETVATAGLSFRDPQPVRDGMICAGDAAGFIDPFLGDGISLALQSGALAGSRDDAAEYEREYRRRFLPVFRRAARLRKLLSAPAAIQKPALLLLKWPGVARAVVERTRANARSACLLGSD